MSEKKNIVQIDLFTTVEIEVTTDSQIQLFHQRVNDGYINATELCNSVNKKFSGWHRLESSQEFLKHLSDDVQISTSELVHIIKGGDPRLQGTWVHPQVAINLAQWLSPKFAVQVSKWVMDWMSGKIPQKNLPYHLERYVANMHKVPQGFFSMLTEMTQNLIAPLEKLGYALPENMLPDISQGKMFSEWLRKEKKMEPKNFPQYEHEYADGRKVMARLYPNEVLAEFKNHFYSTWIKERSADYFAKRDAKALPYLEGVKLLLEGVKVDPFKIKEMSTIGKIETGESTKIIDVIKADKPELDNPNFEKKLERISFRKKGN